MKTPPSDPLPWVTDALDRAGAFERKTEHRYSYASDTSITTERVSDDAASALLEVLTNTVSALHDDAKAYRVVLNKANASAGTLLERRIVEVGSKPMGDDDLTNGQKAAVMMGLVLHEVGHIRYSRAYSGAVTRLFGAGNVTGAITTLSNLAADCHDEAEAMDAFPGLAPTIGVALWWVGGKGSITEQVLDLDKSVQVRVNAAIAATRYSGQVDWDKTPGGTEWLEWWRDWAKRARHAGRPKVHALMVQEAIVKVRGFTPTTAKPQQEQPPERPSGRPDDEAAPTRDMGDDQPEGDDASQDGSGGSQDGSEGDDAPQDESGQQGGSGDATDDDPQDESGSDDDGSSAGSSDDHETSESGQEAKTEEAGTQGGLGDEDQSAEYRNALDEDRQMDDPCIMDAAKDDRADAILQHGADLVSRGKREGMKKRVYHHSSSVWDRRVVLAVPRKGRRWVYDD